MYFLMTHGVPACLKLLYTFCTWHLDHFSPYSKSPQVFSLNIYHATQYFIYIDDCNSKKFIFLLHFYWHINNAKFYNMFDFNYFAVFFWFLYNNAFLKGLVDKYFNIFIRISRLRTSWKSWHFIFDDCINKNCTSLSSKWCGPFVKFGLHLIDRDVFATIDNEIVYLATLDRQT